MLQDCSFLAFGFCLLVGKAGLEASVGILVGGADACPLVGGSWFLALWLARLCLRCVQRWLWALWSLGSLSTDGWGCVPLLLVVLPEASQNWSLQAVGWGRVLVLMTQVR